jgi:hypothetical protein
MTRGQGELVPVRLEAQVSEAGASFDEAQQQRSALEA